MRARGDIPIPSADEMRRRSLDGGEARAARGCARASPGERRPREFVRHDFAGVRAYDARVGVPPIRANGRKTRITNPRRAGYHHQRALLQTLFSAESRIDVAFPRVSPSRLLRRDREAFRDFRSDGFFFRSNDCFRSLSTYAPRGRSSRPPRGLDESPSAATNHPSVTHRPRRGFRPPRGRPPDFPASVSPATPSAAPPPDDSLRYQGHHRHTTRLLPPRRKVEPRAPRRTRTPDRFRANSRAPEPNRKRFRLGRDRLRRRWSRVGAARAFASSVRVQDARDDDERVVALVALAPRVAADLTNTRLAGEDAQFARRHRAERRVRAEPSDHRVVRRADTGRVARVDSNRRFRGFPGKSPADSDPTRRSHAPNPPGNGVGSSSRVGTPARAFVVFVVSPSSSSSRGKP